MVFFTGVPGDKEGFGGERVLSEIKRSLHYFKQQFRNEDLDRIIIGKEEEEDWQVVRGSWRIAWE